MVKAIRLMAEVVGQALLSSVLGSLVGFPAEAFPGDIPARSPEPHEPG